MEDQHHKPPEMKAVPNYGSDRKSQKVFALPDGSVWIPNGRSDNPPPNVDPEKWEIMTRKDRREFAARALRKYT